MLINVCQSIFCVYVAASVGLVFLCAFVVLNGDLVWLTVSCMDHKSLQFGFPLFIVLFFASKLCVFVLSLLQFFVVHSTIDLPNCETY